MAIKHPQPFSLHLTELGRQFQGDGFYLVLVFFCLIFLITFIFLYVHWVCHSWRTRNLSVTVGPNEPTLIFPSVAVPVSLGLDADTINSLPVALHCSLAAAKGTECAICLGMFEDDEKVRVLPKCHHAYHSECVDKWLSTQSSCPLCRNSLQMGIPDLESASHSSTNSS